MLTKHSTKKEIISVFEAHGTHNALEACPIALKDNKTFMSLAVQIDGLALAHASYRLRSNKKIVLAAIKQSLGWAFFYAANSVKEELEIIELMSEINPWVSHYYHIFASEGESETEESEFEEYKEYDSNHLDIVDNLIHGIMTRGLSMLLKNPLFLERAPFFVKDNKRIVMALVKNNGLALQFASQRLQNYFKVVMTSVLQNGNALDFAAKPLQTNRRLLSIASKTSGVNGWFYYGCKSLYYQLIVKDPAYQTRYQIDLSVLDALDELSHQIQKRKATLNKGLQEVNETIEKTNMVQTNINESLKEAVNTIDETTAQNEMLKETLERTGKKLEETEELLQEKGSELARLTQDLEVTLIALEKKEAQLEQAVTALEESEARFNQQIERLDEAQSIIATLLIEKESALKLAEQIQKTNTELKEINLENNNLINQEKASTEKLVLSKILYKVQISLI